MSGAFLIYVRNTNTDAEALPGAVELDDGLFLVRTDLTRSQLYHAVKRRIAPGRLLVAPLLAPPKFKGMKRGAAKELSSLEGL
jgi:hypothetical protein